MFEPGITASLPGPPIWHLPTITRGWNARDMLEYRFARQDGLVTVAIEKQGGHRGVTGAPTWACKEVQRLGMRGFEFDCDRYVAHGRTFDEAWAWALEYFPAPGDEAAVFGVPGKLDVWPSEEGKYLEVDW